MTETDVMDALADLAPGAPLAAVRRERPDVVRHTQGTDDAVFAPKDDAGLTRAERAAAALRIAVLLRDTVLRAHYRQRLVQLDPNGALIKAAETGPDSAPVRDSLILAHVDRVTTDPDSAEKHHIDALLAAGLSPRAVVALSELIAYVNYQSRVLAGLRMLKGAP